MRPQFRLFSCTLALALCCLFASTALAMREEKLPDSFKGLLSEILQQVGKDGTPPFKPKDTSPLLDFLESNKDPDTIYYPPEFEKATSAYYQFEINSSMERLLDYAYNDAIPPQALSPSSLRTAYRLKPTEGESDSWQWRLPADDTPQVIRFAEHEEITPDLFTGAYYGYDVDRALILFRYRGHNVFLSVSKQRDISEVGKKGTALGEEENWDYLYSGETGLNKMGLGWVKSYVYDSFSVTVFYETGDKVPKLLCGSFKWLNAGWARVNMVQRKHIHRGLQRYASDLKIILESHNLPDYRQMVAGYSTLRNLSREELRLYLAEYLDTLSNQYARTKSMSRDIFRDLLDPDRYLDLLEVPQLRAIVELEYLKSLLGKQCKLPELRLLTQPLAANRQ